MTIKISTYKQVEETVEIPSPYFFHALGENDINIINQDYRLQIREIDSQFLITIYKNFDPSDLYSYRQGLAINCFSDKQDEFKEKFTKIWGEISKYLVDSNALLEK